MTHALALICAISVAKHGAAGKAFVLTGESLVSVCRRKELVCDSKQTDHPLRSSNFLFHSFSTA